MVTDGSKRFYWGQLHQSLDSHGDPADGVCQATLEILNRPAKLPKVSDGRSESYRNEPNAMVTEWHPRKGDVLTGKGHSAQLGLLRRSV